MRDPYSVLGVSRKATDAEVKSAFRKLAKRHHPDQNADDPKAKDRFAEVNAAYEILGDKESRAKFDRGEIGADGKPRFQGFGGFDGFTRQPPSGSAGHAGTRSSGSFEDILNDLFGGMGGGAKPNEGFTGYNRAGRTHSGPTGNGTRPGGAGPGQDVSLTHRVSLADVLAQNKMRISLPTGKTLDVKMPAGVTDGQQVRLRGQGHPGTPPGDAIITVAFDTHPVFKPDGSDLRVDLPVALYEAVLGERVRVPTLEGSVEMTIPTGYTGGRVFRLRGKGLPKANGTRGDILVSPRIYLPEGEALDDLEDIARGQKHKHPYNPRGPEYG